MQLGYDLEAVLASIYDVYEAQLLLIGQQYRSWRLFKCFGRQLGLQESDVVLEDALEGAL